MSTRKDQLLRRAAGNERSRAVAITREEKALRAVLEKAGAGGTQPDWNQNDPNAPDYVKNRTHWVGKSHKKFVEQTVEITEGYAQLNGDVFFTPGQTYTVVLNGDSYNCVAWNSPEDDSCVLIGNGSIYGEEGMGEDVPFSCDSYSDGRVYLNVSSSGTYTICISSEEETAHKLDEQYIPDNIARVEQVEALQSTIENIIKTVKISHGSDFASTHKQCLDAYNRGDNLIYVEDGFEYEFNKYANNCFYFRRYEPETLKFSDKKIRDSSIGGTEISVSTMKGATASKGGYAGFVPAPSTGQHNMVLYGDATWRDPMIVCSSTEGSTKKFKITIDDTGVITATEVTQ